MTSGRPGKLWQDEGPISQGKILTNVLRAETETARANLKGWSTADLILLARAADQLAFLARQEVRRR